MVGREGQKHLDRLIVEVARGQRSLRSIGDPKVRDSVRIALRMHKETPAAPDAYTRARMRARILARLEPRQPGLLDHAWTGLELLGLPAPYIVRGVAFGAVMVCLGLSAVVASADTLPDDLLYPLKIASEQVRLALADAPGDRAAVELSIAEHRLGEAEKLAGNGRTSDALVASAMFSQHIASAAAELAPRPEADLGAQLEMAFAAQRDRAQVLAATLATDVKSARGAQILAMIAAPTMAPGTTKIEQVAETAARVAVDLANAADVAAAESASIPTAPPSGTPKRSETPPAAFAQRAETPRAAEMQRSTDTPRTADTPRATETAKASATPRAPGSGTNVNAETPGASSTTRAAETPPASARANEAGHATIQPAQTHDPRAADAAKVVRRAADDARAAAEKLKQALKKNAEKGHHD